MSDLVWYQSFTTLLSWLTSMFVVFWDFMTGHFITMIIVIALIFSFVIACFLKLIRR